MKKIILSLVIITCFVNANSQNSKFEHLVSKYSGQEGFTIVYISPYMFDIFSKVETDDEEFEKIAKNLKSVTVLTMEDRFSRETMNEFTNDIKSIQVTNDYKNLMYIQEGNEKVTIYVKDKDNVIKELMLLVEGDEPTLVHLEGNISLSDISSLSKSMNIKGFEHLDKVDKEK